MVGFLDESTQKRDSGKGRSVLTRLGYRATGLLGVAWIAAGAGLDEINNNLDLETREHAIQVLKAYPGPVSGQQVALPVLSQILGHPIFQTPFSLK